MRDKRTPTDVCGEASRLCSVVRSSLQIRGPGRTHLRRAGAVEELHIKKTDKLSAKKQILDKLVIKQTRFRSI